MAGDMFDQAIIAFIKRKYNLLIGERTAEQIKIEIGSAYPMDPEMTMEIKGRNLVDGLPKNIVVHSEDVREALLECLVKITSAIKETLERTPPELSADIIDRGITLTGGGALLRGLDQLIQSETGIDVHIAEDPLDCVAKVPVRCWIMWMSCMTCWTPRRPHVTRARPTLAEKALCAASGADFRCKQCLLRGWQGCPRFSYGMASTRNRRVLP